jgi:hypothetical protein
MSQIKAANDIEKNWEEVEKNATSDQQKLVALKALLQSRMNSIKRSVFVAWNYYAAAYFYLNFEYPTPEVHIDMDAKTLQQVLNSVATWVLEALGESPNGQHINLPDTDAQISLTYTILQEDKTQAITGDAAQLIKNEDGSFNLLWNLEIGSQQLNGVLPNKGNCAIWISEAEFILEGVTPNSKGNLLATIATAGTYENGFGQSEDYSFVTKGLKGNYLYDVAHSKIYDPWKINTLVFMTPTPYTQWTMSVLNGDGDLSTATQLTVNLKISYETPQVSNQRVIGAR